MKKILALTLPFLFVLSTVVCAQVEVPTSFTESISQYDEWKFEDGTYHLMRRVKSRDLNAIQRDRVRLTNEIRMLQGFRSYESWQVDLIREVSSTAMSVENMKLPFEEVIDGIILRRQRELDNLPR